MDGQSLLEVELDGLEEKSTATAVARDQNAERVRPAVGVVAPVAIDLREGTVVELPRLPRQLHLFETARLLSAPTWALAGKRAIDIVVSLTALVVLLPVLAACTVAVAATSRGPVFFKQTRIGREGAPFTFLKFRSMFRDAEERRAALQTANEKGGPIFKIKHDPRITPVGRVLRRWSLDELPQLFHVLSGKMSLVGPRPPLPGEVAQYDEHAWNRLLAKPGITCIWQVSGRSDLDFDTWISMDIEYIEHWTLGLDLKLLVKTVPAVLSGRGAY